MPQDDEREIVENGEVGGEDDVKERTWKYKYHAAAIYLQQGENNEKFSTHPVSHRALPAYVLVHNFWFYSVDLAASLLLLALAFIEKPAVVPNVDEYPWIHSMLELLCLFVICLEVGIKVQWLGLRSFVRHKRSVGKVLVLALMLVEAGVVLVRNSSHFRITRALRPIFLIDSHFSYNVRRFIRQTFQSIPAVLDIIGLLIMVMSVFSILGFFFYQEIDPDYFGTPIKSFVSLFVLLTTANNPDVMMKAYEHSRWNALFFIIYTLIELYFIMNLLLAVVYDTFASNEKNKFRKLFLHKREAAQRALDLLSETHEDEKKEVKIERFIGMLYFLDKFTNLRDMYLCFLALNKSGSGRISEEEFYAIYDVVQLHWRKESGSGCCRLPRPLRAAASGVGWVVESRGFVGLFYCIYLLCGVWYGVEVFIKSGATASLHHDYFALSVSFCTVFSLEILLKLVAFGPRDYWRSGWNKYDFVVTVIALFGIFMNEVDHPLTHLIVLRFLSLFKLLRIKASFRHIFNTVSILIPRFTSAGVVLMVIYYFFAIIGMELFSSFTHDLQNCCNETLVAGEFVHDPVNNKTAGYYLNSFENLLVSAVTLWDLMVVNNWFIIMEGFTSVSGTDWTRLFFMLYFIVMMVVLNIVVAFILEGFIFRIQVSRASPDDDDPDFKEELVRVPKTEVELLCGKGASISDYELRTVRDHNVGPDDEVLEFSGFRWKDRADFSEQLYSSEIGEWVHKQNALLAEVRSISPLSASTPNDAESAPEGRLSD